MTPANLPDLYARVVAKRPELAVKWHIDERFVLVHRNDQYCIWWTYRHDDGLWCFHTVDDPDAAALILAKWVEALPCGGHLVHGHGTGASVQWRVELPERPMLLPSSPTPLEALAAFWMEYNPSPKESA